MSSSSSGSSSEVQVQVRVQVKLGIWAIPLSPSSQAEYLRFSHLVNLPIVVARSDLAHHSPSRINTRLLRTFTLSRFTHSSSSITPLHHTHMV